MKQIIILAVIGVIAILYATPSFYLRYGVNNDNPDAVARYLGAPSHSTDNPDGTTLSIYKVEKIPPLCVEYMLTFKNALTGDDASQQTIGVKSVLSKWTWRWCPSEKAEKEEKKS
jgi:hypothetical protein